MNPARKVAVSGENRNREDATFTHCFGNRFCQRAGISDAGRATVADDAKTDGFQILKQTHSAKIALRRRRSLAMTGGKVRMGAAPLCARPYIFIFLYALRVPGHPLCPPKIPNCVLDLRVSKQDLDRTKIARREVEVAWAFHLALVDSPEVE